MGSTEIPATTPATISSTPLADSVANTSGDFVAMLTQLLGSADTALPAVVSQTKDAAPVDSSSPSSTDAVAVNSALIDSLAALLANAAPMVSQAMAQLSGRTAVATEGGNQTGADMGGAQNIALVARMLADNASGVARDAQTLLQSALKTAADANTTLTEGGKPREVSATPDGTNNANNAIATAARLPDDVNRADMQIKERVGTGAWHDELGAKLNWMIERGVQSGSLRLSPENLGPLEVRISVQKDQATVWFGAAHAETRASLEQALPRLRELLAASGLSLADAGVFREPPKETFKNNSDSYPAAPGNVEIETGVASIGTRNGLLDAYA